MCLVRLNELQNFATKYSLNIEGRAGAVVDAIANWGDMGGFLGYRFLIYLASEGPVWSGSLLPGSTQTV